MKSNKLLDEILNPAEFLFILLVCLFCFVFNNVLLNSPDLSCIISSGSQIIDNLSVYLENNILFTGTNSFWVNCNWLSDVIYSIFYKVGSYRLVIIFGAILVASLFAIVFRQMMLKFNNWLVNLVMLSFGILACWDCLGISSRLFSYLFILAYFYLLNNIVEKGYSKKSFIYLLLVTVFWANIGTDFLVGILIIAIYCFSFCCSYLFKGEQGHSNLARQFILIVFACLVISLLNPFGINLIAMVSKYYYLGLSSFNPFLASPDFHIKLPFFFFELFIALFVFLAAFSNYKLPLYKLLTIAFLFLISLYSSVNIGFFIVLSLPILAEIINNSDELLKIPYYKEFLKIFEVKIKDFKVYLTLPFVVAILIVVYLSPTLDKKLVKLKNMPVKAVKYMKESKIEGKMFNALGWGCYLANELGCKVFIEERMYKINKQTLLDYHSIVNVNKDYQSIIEKNDIKLIVIPNYFILNEVLKDNKTWKKLYKDNFTSVYTKNVDK